MITFMIIGGYILIGAIIANTIWLIDITRAKMNGFSEKDIKEFLYYDDEWDKPRIEIVQCTQLHPIAAGIFWLPSLIFIVIQFIFKMISRLTYKTAGEIAEVKDLKLKEKEDEPAKNLDLSEMIKSKESYPQQKSK